MDLFGEKIAAANAATARVLSLLAVFGYKPATAEAATPEGAAAQLAALNKAAGETAAAPLTTQLAAYTAGLKAAGVTFAAEQTTPDATAVQAAVEKAIAAKATATAAKTVASAGHEALTLPDAKTAATNANAETPATAEEFMTNLKAINDPVKRSEYYRKHEAKFPVR